MGLTPIRQNQWTARTPVEIAPWLLVCSSALRPSPLVSWHFSDRDVETRAASTACDRERERESPQHMPGGCRGTPRQSSVGSWHGIFR
mmetsp:Transcript_52509/g.96740  ORF Transcript_52509/g.96740 Transcript_52509/m.96740 type:complete len:88 (-) Transcript_52509:17-280(-)